MIIALDVHCPKTAAEQLRKKGHEVLVARDGVPDDKWVDDFYLQGAEIFVSADMDIPILLDRYRDETVTFIELPQGMRKGALVNFILRKIDLI